MIMSHHHDKEDTDVAREQTYKWLFLSQGRLRNPREPKGEKQLHIKFQILTVESRVLLLKHQVKKQNFHLPSKTPQDENVSKKIQGSNLNSGSSFCISKVGLPGGSNFGE